MREIGSHLDAVARFGPRPKVISLGKEAACVEGREGNVEPGGGDDVGYRLILDSETRGENHVAGQGGAQGLQPL